MSVQEYLMARAKGSYAMASSSRRQVNIPVGVAELRDKHGWAGNVP